MNLSVCQFGNGDSPPLNCDPPTKLEAAIHGLPGAPSGGLGLILRHVDGTDVPLFVADHDGNEAYFGAADQGERSGDDVQAVLIAHTPGSDFVESARSAHLEGDTLRIRETRRNPNLHLQTA